MSKMVLALMSVIIFSSAQQRDSIVRVGACATPGAADGVHTQDLYSYIADRGGLTSVEISIPISPIVLDYLNVPYCSPTGVYVRDTFAFLNSAGSGPAFTIAKISDPTNLIRISWVEVPIYGGDEPRGLFVIDSLVYFADSDPGFLIINISDILNPTTLCTLDTPGRVIDLYVRDTLVYLADKDSLLIVTVTDPSNPIIIGHIGIPGGGAYDVWVSGDYAFVTEEDWLGGQGKLNMIDISDPTAPTFVEQVTMAATPYGLFVVDDKIYIAADDWWQPGRKKGERRANIEGGVRVVHWEEPDSMSLLVSFDTPGRCRDIFVVDSFIYAAAWDSFMIYKYVSTGVDEIYNKNLVSSRFLSVYPNPFNNHTRISFTISNKSLVTVEIYDALGRRVRDLTGGLFIPGRYEVSWNGKDNSGLDVASGVYYIRLSTKSGVVRHEIEEKITYIHKGRRK